MMKRALDEVLDALAEHHPARQQPWLVGSPFFDPPAVLLAALRETTREERFDYPPSRGIPELRRSICELHAREGDVLSEEEVVVTHGAKAGLLAVFGSLVGPGDEILHASPTYPAYPVMASTFGAVPRPLTETGGRFSWTAEELEARITDKTRLVVLSSPSNPSGATLGEAEAETLVGVCRERGIRLICDEAYEAFRFAGERGSPALRADPELGTVVLLRSFSKSYAVCGWRIGYVAADAALTDRVIAWQSARLNPPNLLAQRALVQVTEVPSSYRRETRLVVAARLEELVSFLRGLGLRAERPAGGFYIWLELGLELSAAGFASTGELCIELARRVGLALWPGEDYQAPGWVRISAVACEPSHWIEECRQLGQALRTTLNLEKE